MKTHVFICFSTQVKPGTQKQNNTKDIVALLARVCVAHGVSPIIDGGPLWEILMWPPEVDKFGFGCFLGVLVGGV